MKKYLNIIAIAVIALFTYSCEETVNGVDLPYQELLVIRAELRADYEFNMHITKTLPPLEEYSIEKVQIEGVTAFIECEGVKYPLYKNEFGTYFNSELVPKAGKTYKLFAQWKNHIVRAETTVPINKDTVYNVYSTKETKKDNWGSSYQILTIHGTVELSGNSVTILNGIGDEYYYNSPTEFVSKLTNNYKGEIEIGKYNAYNNENYKLKSVIISKYDNAYFEYYQTKDEGEMESDVFVVSGNNITWNVKGDGIGLFIGSNKKEIFLKWY